jgi:repressor LexA
MHSIQKKILRLARKEDIGQLGYRKLGEKIGVEHPQQVKYHLQKLLDTGRLIRTPFGVLRVSEPSAQISKLLNIPILGQANCGEPLSFAEESDWGNLTVSPSLVKSKHPQDLFAVKASGDSMTKARISGSGIQDGDYVIVDSTQTTPSSGQYVVSSIEGLANIKKYVRDESNGVIVLASESHREIPPIILDPDQTDTYHIHGTVVGVMKGQY